MIEPLNHKLKITGRGALLIIGVVGMYGQNGWLSSFILPENGYAFLVLLLAIFGGF